MTRGKSRKVFSGHCFCLHEDHFYSQAFPKQVSSWVPSRSHSRSHSRHVIRQIESLALLVERGLCPFRDKVGWISSPGGGAAGSWGHWQVRNAYEAGYKALIVSNTLPGASKATKGGKVCSTVSQHLESGHGNRRARNEGIKTSKIQKSIDLYEMRTKFGFDQGYIHCMLDHVRSDHCSRLRSCY